MDWIDAELDSPEINVELYFMNEDGEIERGTLDYIESIGFDYVKWSYIEVIY